jgi:hypothetical protein
MLRFIKHHLATEDYASFFGIVSLLIFTSFFLIVLIRIYRMKKETIDELSNIPLGIEDSPLQKDTK